MEGTIGICRNCGAEIKMMAYQYTEYCCGLCEQGSPPPHPSMISQDTDEARRRGR